MTLKRIASVFCVLLLTACSSATSSADLRPSIDAKLAADAQRYGIPAQSVLVMRNGEVLYRTQRGLADTATGRAVAADDVYAVYSVSKLFASILILQLVDQNRLDLEQPARLYAPDLPEAWSEVTVGQLLSHTSGLPDFFDGADPQRALPPTKEDVFRSLADRPLLFAPGAETRYGQTNYVVLLSILENLHGASYRDIVRDRILRPLALNDTYLGLAHAPRGRLVSPYRGENGELVPDPTPPWQDYSIAHAELYTTPDDLGAFLTAVAQGELVRQETLVRAWRPYQLRSGEDGVFAAGWDYGESGRYREVGLDGGVKVRVRIVFRDESLSDHYVIVYLTNGSRENVWTRTLLDPIQDITLRDEERR
ncbi:MAG TPA: serine hydrolase domain-containing protein [Vitreimonas sp.]|uniref:serine hydrolase domain-containing protein n=1 Tax=Vitreimonas sp. TaxID=3069702 RepID=UPI002D338424|nr:serine hydrolase domain-containing protein [Vitreimonas sp.]HYD86533.1 serine hydrolase domain-containing protein [Vitreimonas sp.]